jgi:hypothetical protein
VTKKTELVSQVLFEIVGEIDNIKNMSHSHFCVPSTEIFRLFSKSDMLKRKVSYCQCFSMLREIKCAWAGGGTDPRFEISIKYRGESSALCFTFVLENTA